MTTNLENDRKGYETAVYKCMTNELRNLIISIASNLMSNFISHPSTLSSIASVSTRVLAAWGFRKWFLRVATDMLIDVGNIDISDAKFNDVKDGEGNLKTVYVDETAEPQA